MGDFYWNLVSFVLIKLWPDSTFVLVDGQLVGSSMFPELERACFAVFIVDVLIILFGFIVLKLVEKTLE